MEQARKTDSILERIWRLSEEVQMRRPGKLHYLYLGSDELLALSTEVLASHLWRTWQLLPESLTPSELARWYEEGLMSAKVYQLEVVPVRRKSFLEVG